MALLIRALYKVFIIIINGVTSVVLQVIYDGTFWCRWPVLVRSQTMVLQVRQDGGCTCRGLHLMRTQTAVVHVRQNRAVLVPITSLTVTIDGGATG